VTWLFTSLSFLLAAGRTLVVAPDGDYVDLATALAAASDGDIVEVRGGVHDGPFVLQVAAAVVGINRPVLDGGGAGTVMTFEKGGGRLEGFAVRNSGDRNVSEDAGLHSRGRVTVRDNSFVDVLYGIDIELGAGSVVESNTIVGRDIDVARRGDAIRLWESPDSIIAGNTVTGARDIVVWFSEGVVVRDNVVSRSRYGLHFMYAAGSRVTANRFEDNAVGGYAMYSGNLRYEANVFSGSHGPSGYGLALKDSDDIVLRGNVIAGNRVGVYLDNSPGRPDSYNAIYGNTIAFNDIGMAFMPSVKRNSVGDNSFVENLQQVAVLAGGDFSGNDWTPDGRGNYWSGYVGYDADADGFGELPYHEVSLFYDLLQRKPELRLFSYSPAHTALDMAARTFPVFQPAPTLTDTAPRVRPVVSNVALPHKDGRPAGVLAAGLVLGACALAVWALVPDRRAWRRAEAMASRECKGAPS
jgi:nitrous oxidase accessory protein